MCKRWLVIGLCLLGQWAFADTSTDLGILVNSKKLFLGVDGLGWEAYQRARSQGLFQQFKHEAIHIASFPVISDFVWNTMVRARDVHGRRGRMGSYEATYYNDSTRTLMSDPREYLRRHASSYHYMAAFDSYLNPYVENLMYFPSKEIIQYEIDQVKRGIELAKDEDVISAYIAATDATAHTKSGILFSVLEKVDKMVTEIQAYFELHNLPLEVYLVSDHGNVGRFDEGNEEIELFPVELEPIIKRAGLNRTAALANQNDVVAPVLALGSYASFIFKEREQLPVLLEELKKEVWFELAIYFVGEGDGFREVAVETRRGKSHVFYDKREGTYRYSPTEGNPLGLPAMYQNVSLSSEDALNLTINTSYPDSLFRVIEATSHEEADAPDLLVTLKDSYYVNGATSEYVNMYRTHGSLSPGSSYGVLLSTDSELPQFIRTKDILSAMGIDPRELFEVEPEALQSDPFQTAEILSKQNYRGIETGAGEMSEEKILALFDRFVRYSMYFFDVDSMESIIKAFETIIKDHESSEVAPAGTRPKTVITTEELGELTDILLTANDPTEIESDVRFQRIRDAILVRVKLKKEGVDEAVKTPSLEEVRPYALPLKRLISKVYGIPALLQKVLAIPELPYLKDDRDQVFATEWMALRKHLFAELSTFEVDQASSQQLFSEIFLERQYAEKIYPKKLPLLYNRLSALPDEITLVYVPGIYDSLFDGETFSMGLDALKHHLGARVIRADVDTRCGAEINGPRLMAFLKEDFDQRVVRGHVPPTYFLFGYSKGGVDSLYALLEDRQFVHDHVEGLLTIAAPLQGADVVRQVDLHGTIVEMLSESSVDEACSGEGAASYSLITGRMRSFWTLHKEELAGLTRYYSVSLASTPEASHPWMQTTKLVGSFLEPNDGIVAVRASHFPDGLYAVDLGVVRGDHLAGLVAGPFPQEAFMEALLLTLLELDAFSGDKNNLLNVAIYDSYQNKIRTNHPVALLELIHPHVGPLLGFGSDPIDERALYDVYDREFLVGLSEKLLKKVATEIKKVLSNTDYAVYDFTFTKKGDRLYVQYSTPGAINYLKSWVMWTDDIEIQTTTDLVNLLLSDLQQGDVNYLDISNEVWKTYPASNREACSIVGVGEEAYYACNFDSDRRLSMRSLKSDLGNELVKPIEPSDYPEGIDIIFDHRRLVDFRNEYQFHYDSGSPSDIEENAENGISTALHTDNELYARFRPHSESLDMTTLSFRFKPVDFPHVSMRFMIMDGVNRADPIYGGNGMHDSALYIRFALRELKPGQSRASAKGLGTGDIYLFSYYWGEQLVDGQEDRPLGKPYLNYYSESYNVLPKAQWLPLQRSSPETLGRPWTFDRNLANDIAAAYPAVNIDNMEVLAITIVSDANHTKDIADAWFKFLKFMRD